jgi:hypothetical protein
VPSPRESRRRDEKRRTPSQRIGSAGEAAFRHLASQQGLLPTKMEEDFGLDFICQIDEDSTAKSSSTIGPMVLGVSVRSTNRRDQRVTLSRADATALLRADFPVSFVLVDPDARSPQAWFKPLDAAFRDELLTFLSSTKAKLSQSPQSCRPWTEVTEWLSSAIKVGFTEREKLGAAEERLRRSIEEVSLEVRRTSDGAVTVLTSMDLYAYYKTLDESEGEKLYQATFGAANRASERISQLALKRELISELDQLPQPLILRGFTYEDPRVLRVEGSSGVAECTLLKRSNGEHVGWCLPEGFALTASKRKKQGNLWVHELQAFADSEEDIDLADHVELMNFLRCCEPEAQLGEVNDRPLPFVVEQFTDLPYFGWFAQYVDRARLLDGWDGGLALLKDALDEETLDSLGWLAALADMPSKAARLGFSLEDSDPHHPASFRLPCLVNTATATVVCWLDCRGNALLHGEALRGLMVDEVSDVHLEVRPRAMKMTRDPEFVLDSKLVIARGRGSFYQPAEDGSGIYENLGLLDVQLI